MRKIILVPIWLLSAAMYPFLPASHLWKTNPQRAPSTLDKWVGGATDFAYAFSIAIWIAVICQGTVTVAFVLRVIRN